MKTSQSAKKRSNRTFMELKYAFDCALCFSQIRSNRTFMELKFFIESNGVQ